MSLRIPAKISMARAKANDPEIISNYFDMYEKVVVDYDIIDKPIQIFNIDETGLPIDHRPPKIICKTGSKNPACITSGNKTQVTIVACVNAAGYSLPPMVIWNLKTMQGDMARGEVRGTVHAFSDNGWIDQELFDIWFHNVFLQYAPAIRPLLLLMDGHSTHYCPSTIRAAANHQVILFTLPPNTTHISQPLDKGVFGPLKVNWGQICHDYLSQNPGKVVSRFTFSPLFNRAWTSALTVGNIQGGFETTGIYPLDRSKLLPNSLSDESFNNDALPFLPMLTPSRSSVLRSPNSTKHGESPDVNAHLCYTYGNNRRTLAQLLNCPKPVHTIPLQKVKPKPSARVITGAEFLRQLDEKEQKKAEEAFRKEERKHLRYLKKS